VMDTGLHVAPVGGSDDHRAGVDLGAFQSAIGSPTTLIEAAGPTTASLRAGLLASRTVVKLQGQADPMLTLTVDDADVRDDRGDTVLAPQNTTRTVTVTASAASQNDILVLIQNGLDVAQGPASVPLLTSVVVPSVGETRLRAELRRDGHAQTLTGCVWFRASPETGCGQVGSLASCAALCALLLRRASKFQTKDS
jgi:hypothetical protein